MQAVILAGGLGTRLQSRLADLPKPMAPVRGRPFLEILLLHLARHDIEIVTLSVGHLGERISDHFGSSFAGLTLRYSVEETPLGTGGAIKRALEVGVSEPFLVLNGDTFAGTDPGALAKAGSGDAGGLVMSVVRVDDVQRYGSVELNGTRAVELKEKGARGPGLINAGAYLLSGRFVGDLRRQPDKFSFERDLLTPWVHVRGAACVESPGPFVDIGIPDDLDRAGDVLRGVVPGV